MAVIDITVRGKTVAVCGMCGFTDELTVTESPYDCCSEATIFTRTWLVGWMSMGEFEFSIFDLRQSDTMPAELPGRAAWAEVISIFPLPPILDPKKAVQLTGR